MDGYNRPCSWHYCHTCYLREHVDNIIYGEQMICPFCKEDIKDGAIKCRFCGSMLTIQQHCSQEQKQRQSDTESLQQIELSQSSSLWGWVLATIGTFIIPFIAVAAVVIGIMAIIRSRVGTGIGIIVTSILMATFSIGFWQAFWPAFYDSLNK